MKPVAAVCLWGGLVLDESFDAAVLRASHQQRPALALMQQC